MKCAKVSYQYFFMICVMFYCCMPCMIYARELRDVNQNDIYPFTKHHDAEKFSSLLHEVRCVVCQNQNLADSNAPLANDLRDKIYQLVLQNKSTTEIKNYLVARYGEFILFKPSFNKRTLVLWLFPLLGLGGILFAFIKTNYKSYN